MLGASRAVLALLQRTSALYSCALPPLSAVAACIAARSAQQLVSLRCFASEPGHRHAGALLVLHPASQSKYSLQEALRLGESFAGATPEYVEVGSASRLRPSPSTFFGSGQVEAVQARVQSLQPDRVFVNHILSGVQQRNLERAFGRPVLDRVGLIIEIFSQRARSNEARLQVELASLEYRASRLVRVMDAASGKRMAFGMEGDTEIVSARERGRSGSSTGGLGGAGGQGESELQLQRRRVADRRKLLLRRLEEVRRTRAVQRAARRRSGKPQVAIVGYTNAGKSSLLSALSKCGDVGVEDRLFATLDPTLRRVMLPQCGRDVILSDTVGFISDLPTQLIEAFQATLEEVTEADLLLHVLDASSPQVLQQRQAVLAVLRELGVSQQRLQDSVIEVWNKVDMLEEPGSSSQAAAAEAADVAAASDVAAVAAGDPAAADPVPATEQEVLQHDARQLPGSWEAAVQLPVQPPVHQQQRQPEAAGAERHEAATEDAEAAPEAGPPHSLRLASSNTSSSGSSSSPDHRGSCGGSSSSSSDEDDEVSLQPAHAGLLPPAVAALLEADAAAAAYRPTAVATSVLHNQGLPHLLVTLEDKLQEALAGSRQASRRSAKVAAGWGQQRHGVAEVEAAGSSVDRDELAARHAGRGHGQP